MKKNAEKAAELVQAAIRATGGDFALSDARRYLMAAFDELTRKIKKRIKRENNIKEEALKKRLSKEEAEKRITYLDSLLELEQSKIQNGSNPSSSP